MITENEPGRYLDPESVRAHARPDGDTSLSIYSNGLWETCPSPRSASTVSGCRESYEAGHFIRRETVLVLRADLPNT